VIARRFLQFINVLIGAGILAIGAGTYWLLWRPMPDTNGTIVAAVEKPVSIQRDRVGMPRILAETEDDLFFAQGFVTAQDRFWQMETYRRLTAGELSEVIGPATLESDREFRKLRLSRIAERRALSLPAADRKIITAYARGVNHYLETHRDRLPPEFTLLGYRPRPWRIEDTLLIGLMMEQNLSESYVHEMAMEELWKRGDPELVKVLWPVRGGSEQQPGSNAWALRGSSTVSGKAMLANDMHLGWSMPGVWYMVHLKGAGWNVAGVSIPGAPLVVVGRNEQIAWGITNLGFDVQDLYWETGAPARAAVEREVIPVKGSAAVPFEQFITARGPVFAGPGGKPVSLRWLSAENRPYRLGLIGMNRARNWEEFRRALQDFPGASSNIAYADAEGNIGLQITGSLPVRKDCEARRVHDPGTCEWEGFIPFEELPSFYNPPQGMVVTGNQNPFPRNYKYDVSGNFAPPYRSNQIRDRLSAKEKWNIASTLQLQADVYSGFSDFLAKQIIAAWDRKQARNLELQGAVDVLRTWDGQMRADQSAPLIVSYTAQHLRRSVAAKAAKMNDAQWEPLMYFAVLENLLRERSPRWFADWDQELIRCLQEAVEEGSRKQGNDVRKWKWGEYQKLTVANPVMARLPILGPYLQAGPVGMDGSSTTVKQTSLRLGPSMRLVVDFGDPNGGVLNVPIGQSGHVLSRHARDQWPSYLRAESYPLYFYGNWEVEATLRLQPESR
jgi:penicillin amidase